MWKNIRMKLEYMARRRTKITILGVYCFVNEEHIEAITNMGSRRSEANQRPQKYDNWGLQVAS